MDLSENYLSDLQNEFNALSRVALRLLFVELWFFIVFARNLHNLFKMSFILSIFSAYGHFWIQHFSSDLRFFKTFSISTLKDESASVRSFVVRPFFAELR